MTQTDLIQVAISAAVNRYIPSKFGADAGNPSASKLPVYQCSIVIHKTLQEEVKIHPEFTYTLIRNGMCLEWDLAHQYHFTFESETPPFWFGGNRPFSATAFATAGQVAAQVLRHLDETKDRVVYVHDRMVTQRQFLGIAQRIARERKWNPANVNIADLSGKSRESYAKEVFDLNTSSGFLCQAVFGEGNGREFLQADNELLGIQT